MKDITRFINEELKPRFYDYIPQIFPEMNFKKKGNKFVSNIHVDGTEGTGYKEDRSVITEKHPYRVFDNTRQESKDIITLYMELNHIHEVWEAVEKLCSIVGVSKPEYSQEIKEKYKKAEQRRTALEESAERQRKALFTPEGSNVLNYLHSRGWTDEEIKEAELGYISTKEATVINAQRSIGDFYKLSIPLRSGSTIYGFKFRTIEKDTVGRDKYTYLYGTEKKANLFNLTGIQQTDGAILVVEGELDALHAQTRGVRNVVATGGGKLTDDFLDVAINRGIKRITLLFDKDERGKKFIKDSLDVAHKRGFSVLVASFPDGEILSDGTPIHDVDEYLKVHSAQELQKLIDSAILGSKYLLNDLLETFFKTHDNSFIGDPAEHDLRNEVIYLANYKTPNEVERDIVLTEYARLIKIEPYQAFTSESLKAVADKERADRDALMKKDKVGEASKAIERLLKDGRVNEALNVMEEAAATLKKVGDREKYGDLVRIPTREERIAKFKEQPEGLKTSYKFTEGGDELPFIIPSGAVTVIAAPTSHGKSAFLRNLAIDIAKRYKEEEESVLYFTFEESEEDVIAQFINTYIGELLHAKSFRHSQVETIKNYYKTGEPSFIGGSAVGAISPEQFIKKEREFFDEYLNSGKIRIFYKDYDLETLIEALEFAVSNVPTKVIFIDYIQILRSQKFIKQPRTEQLKEICISLKDFSVKHKIAVVLAAQLNREVTSPFKMSNTMMAESSDIEKAANTILCLWNSNFKLNLYGGKEPTGVEKKELEELNKKGFVPGIGDNKLFVKITKARGSRGVGMYSIFDFEGCSGKIKENYSPEKEDKEPKQQQLIFKDIKVKDGF